MSVKETENTLAYRDSAAEKILKAAAKLFATKGYAGTTTRDIVSEAGSSLSALHGHFGSKEAVHTAVMERTSASFYKINAPVFRVIEESREQGLMNQQNAWDHLVLLTGHLIDWAYDPEYRYEILLVNQQMLGLGAPDMELPEEMFELYYEFERLFRAYTKNEEGDWAIKLAFYTVTSAFDGANYPHVLRKLIGKDLEESEGIEMMKYNFKSYLVTNLRVQLDLRSQV